MRAALSALERVYRTLGAQLFELLGMLIPFPIRGLTAAFGAAISVSLR